jgi:hypothetical protein
MSKNRLQLTEPGADLAPPRRFQPAQGLGFACHFMRPRVVGTAMDN